MAPKKKQSQAKAPAAKVPMVDNTRRPGSKKAGKLTRAEMQLANKAQHAKDGAAARKVVANVLELGKSLGQSVVGVPYAPAAERYWRKPEVLWSEELEADLFTLMSTGHSMEAISKLQGMPSVYQMMKWFADKTHPFSDCRTRAQNYLVPFYEELAKDISMTANRYVITTRKQVLSKDGDIEDLVEEREVDNVERSKLAVSTLQWTLSHLMPKKHGRNPDQATGGANEQLKGMLDALKAGPIDG